MKKALSSYILLCFLVTSIIGPNPVYAQDFRLPAPGLLVHLSPEFSPPLLKGIKIYPDNPFRVDFILDKGNSSDSAQQLKSEATRLIKYFLASITVPEKDLWVNLSPYEKNRIIPDAFGITEMGRDLLAQDYILKQITASVIYPEGKVGKEFWDKVYTEARKRYGTTDVPIDTFNKVWIVPQKAVVYENRGSAYVVNSSLKVLLEQDYLALEKGTKVKAVTGNVKETNKLGSEVIREIVIPILEKEVNEGKNFAELRQVYNSLILAIWFKDKIKETILGKNFVDLKKTGGVDIEDKDAKDKIWAQYIKAFKKGAFNYIKEDYDPVVHQTVPRKYFSGGAGLYQIRSVYAKTTDSAQLPQDISDRAMIVESNFRPANDKITATRDMAMNNSRPGPLPANSPEERFRREYKAAFPNNLDLFEENPHHNQGNYRRLYDAVAGLLGIDAPQDLERLELGRQALYKMMQADARLIHEAVLHLVNYTYVASAAHRVSPLILAIKNQFLGRNIYSPDALKGLLATDERFQWLNTTHPFYVPTGIYERTPDLLLPNLVLPKPQEKKIYRVLDIGSAPKAHGSAPLNLMRNAFDKDDAWKGHHFEIFGADVFFPFLEKRDGQIEKRQDADLPEKNINGVTYYDASKYAPADILSSDFNKNDVLGRFDYISMTATFHHLLKWKDEEFGDFKLAEGSLFKADGAPFDETYFMARTQQKVVTRLLNSLEDGGIFFFNMTLSMTPGQNPAFPKDKITEHMQQHFIDKSNADNYIIIRREKNHFIVYDQVISFRPSGDLEGTEGYLLKGTLPNFYTKVKISERYPGLVVGDDNYKKIRHILRQVDMQVFWNQSLNKSRWGRVMAAAKAIERGASFPEWLKIYMANVPESKMKTRVLEAAQALDESLISQRQHGDIDSQAMIAQSVQRFSQPANSAASDVGGIDLTRDKLGLQVQSSGTGVQFKFDPALIRRLQNASGLTPIIIDIHPMTTTIPMFLGLADAQSSQKVASL